MNKTIIWTSVDPQVEFFARNNILLQSISKKYTCIFACSNGISTLIKSEYDPRSIVIECENNMSLKGKLVFEYLRENGIDYDVLVRTDVDTLIVDTNKLDKMSENLTGKHALSGNAGIDKSGKRYVRGGCNLTTKSVIDVIDMRVNLTKFREFDRIYIDCIHDVGAEVIYDDCFEIGEWYQGRCPAWHPRKKCDKQSVFMEQLGMLID